MNFERDELKAQQQQPHTDRELPKPKMCTFTTLHSVLIYRFMLLPWHPVRLDEQLVLIECAVDLCWVGYDVVHMPIHISSANVRFNSHTLNNKKQIIHKLLHFPRIPSKPFLLDMLTLFKYMYKITCYLPTVFCSTIIQTIFTLTLEGFNQQIPEINIPKKSKQ